MRARDAVREHGSRGGEADRRPDRGDAGPRLRIAGVEQRRGPHGAEPACEQGLGERLRPGHPAAQEQPGRQAPVAASTPAANAAPRQPSAPQAAQGAAMPNRIMTGRSKKRPNASLKCPCRFCCSSSSASFSMAPATKAARMPLPPSTCMAASVVIESESATVSSDARSASGRCRAQCRTWQASQPMAAPTATAAPTSQRSVWSTQSSRAAPNDDSVSSRIGSATSSSASPSLAPLSAVIAWRRSSVYGLAGEPPRDDRRRQHRVGRRDGGPGQQADERRQPERRSGHKAPDRPHEQHARPECHCKAAPLSCHPAPGQPHRSAGDGDRERHPGDLAQDGGVAEAASWVEMQQAEPDRPERHSGRGTDEWLRYPQPRVDQARCRPEGDQQARDAERQQPGVTGWSRC